MNINVDPHKLMEFATYVSEFSRKVSAECTAIDDATRSLAQTMDAEDVASIQRMTSEIVQILQDSQPTLQTMEQKIEGYANFVFRVQSIARS